MSKPTLHIFESSSGGRTGRLADRALLAEIGGLSTNEHGFEKIGAFIPMPRREALIWYDRPGLPHVEDSAGSQRLFEGRLEDTALVAGGMRIGAFGYQRALSDLEKAHTALWSTTNVGDWRPSTEDDLANRRPKLYTMDTNNRLFIGLTKNSVYTNAADPGGLTFETPNGGSRTIVGVMYAITVAMPLNWNIILRSFNRDWSGGVSQVTFVGTGATYTRAVLATFAGQDRIEFQIFNNSGANLTFAGENGANFIKITGLRVVTSITNVVSTTLTANRAASAGVTATVGSTARMYAGMQLVVNGAGNPSEMVTVTSVTSTTQFVATFVNSYVIGNPVQGFIVYADEIAKDLVSVVSTLNPTQLSGSTVLVQSPGIDLTNEIYEDQTPSDILSYLIGLGDNQSPSQQWEWGVWEDRQLAFRARGSAGRIWSVVAANLPEIERTISDLYNSLYAAYQDANGRTLRTAVSGDTASQNRYALVRRTAISARTTSNTQAGIQRDAALQDQKDPIPRIKIEVEQLYDPAGARWPRYMARSGDTLTLHNVSFQLSDIIDRLGTLRIRRTEWKPGQPLTIELENPIPSLESLIAREAAGIRR